ncbi:hypothetical protein BC830DRAFT_1166293 [Chytriomyces sp. MP71]|nr:hypothetical protein BC830DRAFT_1166293 [Chytriomyces sp. MP71]
MDDSDSDDLFDMSKRRKAPQPRRTRTVKLKTSKFAKAAKACPASGPGDSSKLAPTPSQHRRKQGSETNAIWIDSDNGDDELHTLEHAQRKRRRQVGDDSDSDNEVAGASSSLVAAARAKLEAEKIMLHEAKKRKERSIAEAAAKAAAVVSPPKMLDATSLQVYNDQSPSTGMIEDGEEPVEILVNIFFRNVNEPQKLCFRIAPSQTFRSVFDEVSANLGIPSHEMVFVKNNVELLPLSTPSAFSSTMHAKEQLEISAFFRDHYMERKRDEAQDLERRLRKIQGEQDTEIPIGTVAASQEEPRKGDDEVTLLINLRDSQGRELSVNVRKTTKMSKIAAAFVSKLNLDLSTKVLLEFDHERLDAECVVGDTEIETGDLLDVIVL